MPGVLNVSEAAGRLVRRTREQRGWTAAELSVEMGRMGAPSHVLAPTQLTRIELGQRNITPDEAWRFIEVLDDIDPLELLEAARIVSPDSSEEFRQAIREEAERRRRRGALRRLDFAATGRSSLTHRSVKHQGHVKELGRLIPFPLERTAA